MKPRYKYDRLGERWILLSDWRFVPARFPIILNV